MIRNLRQLYRDEKDVFEKVDINNLIGETLRILNSELVILGVSVAAQLDKNLPLVEGNSTQLQQVLINLINNSCRAMGDLAIGGKKLTLVTESNSGGEVLVRVEDRPGRRS